MTSLRAVSRPVLGLFVEDCSLAALIVAVVLLAGVLRVFVPGAPSRAGVVLLVGCLGALASNLASATRYFSRSRSPATEFPCCTVPKELQEQSGDC